MCLFYVMTMKSLVMFKCQIPVNKTLFLMSRFHLFLQQFNPLLTHNVI